MSYLKHKNNHHGYKTFLEMLEIIHSKPNESKKLFLRDKRLSQHEKKLLHFYFDIREKKYEKLPDILADKGFSSHPFLDSLRFYFLGIAYLCKGESIKAEEYLNKADPTLWQGHNDKFFKRLTFKTNINLYYAYVNLKRTAEANSQYEKIITIPVESEEDIITVKLVHLCYYLRMNKYSNADEMIDELDSMKDKMDEIQLLSFIIDKFNFSIKLENFKVAEQVLAEIKSLRTFRLSANYRYMLLLLRLLSKDERIYIYEKDFKEHPDLLHMIKLIKALDEADLDEARICWSVLQGISPSTYKSNFIYAGDKCLFSLCLEKFRSVWETSSQTITSHDVTYTQHEQKIIDAIRNSNGSQIKKEDLFLQIYQREIQSKEDLGLLAPIIYRINKKAGLTISSKKGCYFIENTISKIA